MTTTTSEHRARQEPSPPEQSRLPAVPAWRRRLWPYFLAVPALAVTIFILYPFALSAWYTLLDYAARNTGSVSVVGLSNFQQVLTSATFWTAVRTTLVYAVVTTAVETVLGVGIALLLYRASRIGSVFEKVLILPLMIAPAIAGVLWRLMFNSQFGVLNHVLGLGSFDWLGSSTALFSVILVDVWIFTPFVAILVLAGVRSLPREPFEASAVDGASWFYMFRRLMLPMMWPYILVAVIFRFMDCLKIFDHVYVLTAGGPGTTTTTLQIAAFQNSIVFSNYSLGATYMFLLWALVFITARYLVSVLGKAQRRAAGAED
ncbi:carbohydrate ABC transporter permease [uncultured Pseudokineococcus sp.]|uniref:carbohydrate ABC transporter permease n=1 Tax=uncultured Pseudokineococcus sp. TaxID=1642928 RepID=UPI00262B83D4|nr:sugar ABC transporter permease [uncultured Pseudokineococcus sp.]